jgi:hypothetical protein
MRVHLVGRPLFGLWCQPRVMDLECGAVGGLTGKGDLSARSQAAPVPLRPPQIPREVTSGYRGRKIVGMSYCTA